MIEAMMEFVMMGGGNDEGMVRCSVCKELSAKDKFVWYLGVCALCFKSGKGVAIP